MIFKDALLALLWVFEVELGSCNVDTSDKEFLLVIVVEKIPHVAMVYFCYCHVFFYLKLIQLA